MADEESEDNQQQLQEEEEEEPEQQQEQQEQLQNEVHPFISNSKEKAIFFTSSLLLTSLSKTSSSSASNVEGSSSGVSGVDPHRAKSRHFRRGQPPRPGDSAPLTSDDASTDGQGGQLDDAEADDGAQGEVAEVLLPRGSPPPKPLRFSNSSLGSASDLSTTPDSPPQAAAVLTDGADTPKLPPRPSRGKNLPPIPAKPDASRISSAGQLQGNSTFFPQQKPLPTPQLRNSMTGQRPMSTASLSGAGSASPPPPRISPLATAPQPGQPMTQPAPSSPVSAGSSSPASMQAGASSSRALLRRESSIRPQMEDLDVAHFSPGQFPDFPKDARSNIVMEIFQTETSYLKGLEVVLTVGGSLPALDHVFFLADTSSFPFDSCSSAP